MSGRTNAVSLLGLGKEAPPDVNKYGRSPFVRYWLLSRRDSKYGTTQSTEQLYTGLLQLHCRNPPGAHTAESDAAFLLPHIKKGDHIKYASEGTMISIDISTDVLQKAKKLAAEPNVPTEGPGSVVFKQDNVLDELPYLDDTFDIVYGSQLLGRMPRQTYHSGHWPSCDGS